MNWEKFANFLLKKGSISFDKRIFMILANDNLININELKKFIENRGLLNDDPRLQSLYNDLDNYDRTISCDDFSVLIDNNIQILKKIFTNDLVVTKFKHFTNQIKEIYDKTIEYTGGHVANYIPQLARVDPDQYGVSLCTVDGQRYSIGDTKVDFSVQSCCKPINYGIVLNDIGSKRVHEYVGREPSGQAFNELLLNKQGKPHNPLINSGAIMTTSLIKGDKSSAERYEYINGVWEDLSANIYKIGFNNPVYLSEKDTADRNFALAYFMKETNDKKKVGFPEGTKINETLELYFQCCSIEVNCEIMSIVASTLANNGVNPLTRKRVWSSDTVKNILSMMMTCGMYDYSGEFAFNIGLPAKSGVAGAIMVVVPNVMGICIWSPRLDKIGNSFRGIEFCKLFGTKFDFHAFGNPSELEILSKIYSNSKQYEFYELNLSAARGDIEHIQHLFLKGVDMNMGDYDGRTPLHLAVCERKTEVVKFLIEKANVSLSNDRWNRTPYDDAIRCANEEIIGLFKKYNSLDISKE